MDELKRLFDGIIEGNAKLVRAITEQQIAGGTDPNVLLNEYMIPALKEIGKQFEAGDCFVPELLMSARAMKGALEILRPLLATRGAEPIGRVAIGTVRGDLHDIGKNLVGAMLEGGGFEVIDLGVDVEPEVFVNAIREHHVGIVAMSALLTTTMGSMKEVVDALQKAGVRKEVKIMVGGAPITSQFADEIGADGYSDNANGAVSLARRLLGVP
jgi:corrinoid protein of di/trimethylamine methyltransferase